MSTIKGSFISPILTVADSRAPSHLNSRLLGHVAIGHLEPSSQYLGNWSPRVMEG